MKKILNVRVDQELKDEIDRIAEEEGITSSEFARNTLYENLNYDEEEKTIREFVEPTETYTIYVGKNIKKELPLLALFLFVNLYSNSYSSEKNLSLAKGFLENLTKNDKLSNDLRFELLKVLNDINRVLAQGIQNTPLYFKSPNNMYTLNYNLLFTEVYNLINRDYRDE